MQVTKHGVSPFSQNSISPSESALILEVFGEDFFIVIEVEKSNI